MLRSKFKTPQPALDETPTKTKLDLRHFLRRATIACTAAGDTASDANSNTIDKGKKQRHESIHTTRQFDSKSTTPKAWRKRLIQ